MGRANYEFLPQIPRGLRRVLTAIKDCDNLKEEMKLPKIKSSGFTLVELMIVIAIIAVLSVVGVTVFSGIQKDARDARRKADIDAVSSAMEANYGKTTAGQYKAMATSFFAEGAFPVDPVNTTVATDGQCPGVCKYCVREGASAQTPGACTIALGAVTTSVPSGGANAYWMVCANLEKTAGTFYCRGNQQ